MQRKGRVAEAELARIDRGSSRGTKALDVGGFLRKRVVHIVLIAALGFAVYSNTFHSSFYLDGIRRIVDNPVIKDLKNFTSVNKGYNYNPRRFVGYLSFALNYYFGGQDVVGYHIVNLLIHICNALLVYFLVLLTFRTPSMRQAADSSPPAPALIALFSGLLFVSHPLQTEAVTYIVQRVTSLAALFYLLSIVSYIKGRLKLQDVEDLDHRGEGREKDDKSAGRRSAFSFVLYILCSLLFAVLAMRTKEITFTLPIMIVLYEFTFFRSSRKKKLLILLPVLLTLLIIPLSILHSGKPLGEILSDVSQQTRVQTHMSRWTYLLTEMRVIVTYIRLIFLPINQNLDYDYPVYHSLFTPSVFLSFLFLLSIAGLGVYLFHKGKGLSAEGAEQKTTNNKQRLADMLPPTSNLGPAAPYCRLISFGIFWFFIALSVESSVIPIVDVIFEHRLYLPSAGVFIGITAGVLIAAKRLRVERVVIPTLVLIVLAFSGLTYARNTIWEDSMSLWQDVVRKSPNKARPHNNLGNAYDSRGQLNKAISEYQEALRLKGIDYIEAYHNLGAIYQSQGRFDKAIEEFQIALMLKPDNAELHFDLAEAYASGGRLDSAVAEYQKALRLKPDYIAAHYDLGNAYESLGHLDKAVAEFQAVLRLKPDFAKAHFDLANAYLSQGRVDSAAAEYQAALRLRPDYAEAHTGLGVAYGSQGHLDKAVKEFQAALRLKPGYYKARKRLDEIASKGKKDNR